MVVLLSGVGLVVYHQIEYREKTQRASLASASDDIYNQRGRLSAPQTRVEGNESKRVNTGVSGSDRIETVTSSGPVEAVNTWTSADTAARCAAPQSANTPALLPTPRFQRKVKSGL